VRSLGVWSLGSLDNSFKEFGSLGVWEFGQYLFILNTQAGRLIIHYPFSIVHRLEARGRLGGVFLYVAKLRLIPLSTKSEALCGVKIC